MLPAFWDRFFVTEPISNAELAEIAREYEDVLGRSTLLKARMMSGIMRLGLPERTFFQEVYGDILRECGMKPATDAGYL